MNTDSRHLTSLFENATEGIILTDGKGKIALVNPAALRTFGYTTEELVGQPIEILIPANVRPHHHQLREGFYEHPSNRVMGHGRDLYGRKKNGDNIPVEVSLSSYKRQEELFVIAFIVDITERKKIENNIRLQQNELEKMAETMRRLNAELENKVEERTLILKEALQKLEESQKELNEALDKERQLNEIKSRFVSMASHEFRTPLSTVLSSASLLAKYKTTEEQDKREKHVEKIRNSVKHLNEILEDFLSLGKLDEGKVAVTLVETELVPYIAEIVDEMRGLLKPGQDISFSYSENLAVATDRKLLKHIMINLLTNAIKFSPDDKPIQIKCKRKDNDIIIQVRDHGIGISREDQEHLFSSFYRGKNAVNIQGTGLGLHIVKRYVDLLGGSIHVDSVLQEGTCFELIFPRTNNSTDI